MIIDIAKIKYVIGLGNPGSAYSISPHNLGFILIDMLLKKYPPSRKIKVRKQDAWEVGDRIFSKPNTYMNLSGEAVLELRQLDSRSTLAFAQSILVLHDDITLDMYKIRHKDGSIHQGAGGHNGIRSIADALMRLGLKQEEAKSFDRIRIGCNTPERLRIPLDRYVTAPMSKDQLTEWDKTMKQFLEEIQF